MTRQQQKIEADEEKKNLEIPRCFFFFARTLSQLYLLPIQPEEQKKKIRSADDIIKVNRSRRDFFFFEGG